VERRPAAAKRKRIRHLSFLLFLLLFPLIAAAMLPLMEAERAILVGFDAAAAWFIAATWIRLSRADLAQLRQRAAGNDANRSLLLLVAFLTCAVVVTVIGLEVGRLGEGDATGLVLVIATLTLAWLFANMIYAVHYAHLYYDPGDRGGDHGGLLFPGGREPRFADFCYFAFVLGMTFQVSDVQIESASIRKVATVHGLVAFLFNVAVVALTVNVVGNAV
jgi:uncharacterized membrane protein